MPPERRESADVHAEVVRWLDRRDPGAPFLLYIHTWTPHLPYDPPPAFRERFAAGVERRDSARPRSSAPCSRAAWWTRDSGRPTCSSSTTPRSRPTTIAFGELLDELERRGLVEDTVGHLPLRPRRGVLRPRRVDPRPDVVPRGAPGAARHPPPGSARGTSSHRSELPTSTSCRPFLELAGLAPLSPACAVPQPARPPDDSGRCPPRSTSTAGAAGARCRAAATRSATFRLGYVGPAELYGARRRPGRAARPRRRAGAARPACSSTRRGAKLRNEAGRWDVAARPRSTTSCGGASEALGYCKKR